MKILVLGAAGFIGSALVSSLCKDGHSVVGVDNLNDTLYPSSVKMKRLHDLESRWGSRVIVSAAESLDLVEMVKDFDWVVNQAAIPGLTPSWAHPEAYFASNTVLVAKISQACSYAGVPLLQASTSSVYGNISEGPEDSPLSPISPYGVSKLAAENLVRTYAQNLDLRYTILRYFSVYGEGQRPDMAYSIFIRAALSDSPVTIFGSGEQVRTNTHVDDIVQGTKIALLAGPSNDVFNMSGATKISVNQALSVIEDALETKLVRNYQPVPLGDQVETVGSTKKFRAKFQWSPQISLQEGLFRQAHWARKNWNDNQ